MTKTMNKVIPIKNSINMPGTLRRIARLIDIGEIETDSVTVIAGTEVFNAGIVNDEKSIERAIFDMNFGIHKIMTAAVEGDRGET